MQTTRGLSMVIDRDVSGAVPTKKYKIPPRQALAPVPVQKAEAVYLIGLMRYFHRSLVEIDVWCLDVVTLLLGCKRSPIFFLESCRPSDNDSNDVYRYSKMQKSKFRIGELNPGLVGTYHLSMIESDKS
jgi:hypothetical protein